MKKGNLYVDIWKKALPAILTKLNDGSHSSSISLDKKDFIAAGKRQRYTFTLKYNNGQTPRNGTAVGRDLQMVLSESPEFRRLAANDEIILKFTGKFVLEITVNRTSAPAEEAEPEEQPAKPVIKVYVVTDSRSIELIEEDRIDAFRDYLKADETIIFPEPIAFDTEREALAFSAGVKYGSGVDSSQQVLPLLTFDDYDLPFIEIIERY